MHRIGWMKICIKRVITVLISPCWLISVLWNSLRGESPPSPPCIITMQPFSGKTTSSRRLQLISWHQGAHKEKNVSVPGEPERERTLFNRLVPVISGIPPDSAENQKGGKSFQLLFCTHIWLWVACDRLYTFLWTVQGSRIFLLMWLLFPLLLCTYLRLGWERINEPKKGRDNHYFLASHRRAGAQILGLCSAAFPGLKGNGAARTLGGAQWCASSCRWKISHHASPKVPYYLLHIIQPFFHLTYI